MMVLVALGMRKTRGFMVSRMALWFERVLDRYLLRRTFDGMYQVKWSVRMSASCRDVSLIFGDLINFP